METHMIPKVAVIIPTYNRWPYVCDAIDSVLGQNYHDIQCIVVDDASRDGSAEKLREKYGNKIKLVQNPSNRDKAFCRNLGVFEAAAEYVCFLDSDDTLPVASVSARVAYYLGNPSFDGVVFGNSFFTGRSGETKEVVKKREGESLELSEYLGDHGFLNTNTFMLSRENMLKYGMYNEGLSNKEDVELFIRLFCRLEFRCCGQTVANVRSVASSRARNDYERILSQWDRFSKAVEANREVVEKIGGGLEKIRHSEYGEILRSLYHSEKYREFREVYRKGVSTAAFPGSFRFRKRYILSYFKELKRRLT